MIDTESPKAQKEEISKSMGSRYELLGGPSSQAMHFTSSQHAKNSQLNNANGHRQVAQPKQNF